MTEPMNSVEVSRRIAAPAARIFEILATPRRHAEIDGSGMLRGVVTDRPIAGVGETFTVKMHRLGRDYEMINHVVEFEPNRLLTWEPAPGDVETAGGDPSRIGVPSGYRWGYRLVPDGDTSTIVTEVFDCVGEENRWILQRDGGGWINGNNPVVESMTTTLELLEKASTA
jgi:uncharacterized protein YndB with AHSA1/START domain